MLLLYDLENRFTSRDYLFLSLLKYDSYSNVSHYLAVSLCSSTSGLLQVVHAKLHQSSQHNCLTYFLIKRHTETAYPLL